MRALFVVIAFLFAVPATAQQVSSLVPPATAADIQAVQAQIPKPSSSVPMPDMAASGVVGSSPQYRRVDDQAPRVTRSVSGVTVANGTAAVTWPAMPSVPKLLTQPYVAMNAVITYDCYPVIGTVTVSGATFKCFEDQSLLGIGLFPRKAATAGVQFDVFVFPGS